MRKVAAAILLVLFASFVGIDLAHVIGIIKRFPAFLFYENIVYAVASVILLIALLLRKNVYPLVTFFGAYLFGRVSRSVITPYGTVPKLAPQHVPLLLLSLALVLVGLYGCYKH